MYSTYRWNISLTGDWLVHNQFLLGWYGRGDYKHVDELKCNFIIFLFQSFAQKKMTQRRKWSSHPQEQRHWLTEQQLILKTNSVVRCLSDISEPHSCTVLSSLLLHWWKYADSKLLTSFTINGHEIATVLPKLLQQNWQNWFLFWIRQEQFWW